MFKDYVYNSNSFLKMPQTSCIQHDIFSFDSIDYRSKILRNEISVFEISGYLFARKANLLSKMGKILSLISFGHRFANSLNMVCFLAGNFLYFVVLFDDQHRVHFCICNPASH